MHTPLKQKVLISLLFFVVMIAIYFLAGIPIYKYYIEPFKRPFITVNDSSLPMGYFLKRLKLAGIHDPIVMVDILTKEEIIIAEAEKLGLIIEPSDVDRALRAIARGESNSITQVEYDEWYRQQLNASKLSDTEFKKIISTGLKTQLIIERIGEDIPTIAEQVHLKIMYFNTLDESKKARLKLNAGILFENVLGEITKDQEGNNAGTDLGWIPRGIKDAVIDEIAFNLEPGEISGPILQNDRYCIIMVSEKASAQSITKTALKTLKYKAFTKWLDKQKQTYKIHYNLNSETYAWIREQLERK